MYFDTTEWPSTPIPQSIKNLLDRFLQVGDSRSEDASRVLSEEIFTPDGQIIVNKKVISGAEEISKSNHGMPPGLESRQHEIIKVYTCNEAADDLIVVGRVYWTFPNGERRDEGFAARAVLAIRDEKLKLKLYQGWTDPSEMVAMLQQLSS